MAIEITCECGKRFRAKDEYAGRRGICPACRAEFSIPVPAAESTKPTASAPPPIASGESERERNGSIEQTTAKRPIWKDPILVIGAAVPTTILMTFFGFLAVRSGMFQSNLTPIATAPPPPYPDITEQVAHEQLSFADVVNPTPAEVLRWRSHARYRAEKFVEMTFGGDEEIDHFDVLDITVEPCAPDPRKVSWLWRATIKVAVIFNLDLLRKPSTAHQYVLIGLFRMVPPDNCTYYWWEMQRADSPVPPARKHLVDSEWKGEFRSAVSRAWNNAMKRHGADVAAKRFSNDRDAGWAWLGHLDELATLLNITQDEVKEIADESFRN
jgi:hypothetical protein